MESQRKITGTPIANRKQKKFKHKCGLFILLGIQLLGIVAITTRMLQEQKPYAEAKHGYEKIRAAAIMSSSDEDGIDNAEAQAVKEVNLAGDKADIAVDEALETDIFALDWAYLKNLNPDIIAWLRIPGTSIDYPVLKGESLEYYLNHMPDGRVNKLGSLFVSPNVSSGFEDVHNIIYGHNMASGQMFGTLSQYYDVGYARGHEMAYVYTPENTYVYHVYSCYVASVEDPVYQYPYTLESLDGLTAYQDMMKHMKDASYWQPFYSVDETIAFYHEYLTLPQETREKNGSFSVLGSLTLSTCTNDISSTSRTVVNFALVSTLIPDT